MKAQSGYTIIEALCAFAIMAITLLLLFQEGQSGLHLASRVSRHDEAVLLATSKLEEIAAQPAILPLRASGQFRGSGIGWRMKTLVVPDDTRTDKSLQDVRLTLFWRVGVREREIRIWTRHLATEKQ